MLKKHQSFIDNMNRALAGTFAFSAFYIWYLVVYHFYEDIGPFHNYLGAIVIFLTAVIISLIVRKVSVSERFISIHSILLELIVCYISGMAIFAISTYIFKFPHLSRVYVIGGVLLSYVLTAFFYLLNLFFYKLIRSYGLNFRNVLLIGNKYTIPAFIETIENNKALGLKIVGVMSLEEMDAKEVFGHKYLGSVGHIRKALNAEPIDYAIFSVYRQDPAAVERAILACQERGIEIWLKPDFIQKITLSHVDYLESIPLFIFSFAPKSQFALLIKRIIDVVGSLAALTILAIPMLIITMAIKSTSKGAAIFKQKRIGLNGRRFIMYKFRTMQSESQQRKTELKLKNEMKGPAFKMKKDPRVTRIGCSLRKYSMDELPQLWNVLLGDMSFVGPRPPLPSEVNLYEGWQRRRLSMRPGLTCIWQVEGRNRISDFEEWVKLDLKYIDTWSLWLDLKILLKTIPAVLKGTGC